MTNRRSARFWLVTAAALTGVAVALALGAWQLGRAAQKIALQAALDERLALPAIDGAALLAAARPAELIHRPVVLRGQWIERHTVFLDNRQMRGKPGFYVVTPLKLEGAEAAVLVERGWVARNFVQREALPAIDTPPGRVEVRGRMAPPPGKLYEFDGASGGQIRQNLDLPQYRAETGLPLLDVAVKQTGEPSEGLLRDWPQVASGVEKHYGYAFQWWALGALIAILYVWFQFIAPRRKVPHA